MPKPTKGCSAREEEEEEEEEVYKNGSKQDISNYRPISIQTSFSKIFEKVMHSRILNHINKYNILNEAQYGFRTNLKTDNTTYKLTTKSLNALNNKSFVGGIFCDLQKAFHCVNHKILLSKLNFYGINGTDLKLYKSYLENRYQRIYLYNEDDLDNTISKWARVKHGSAGFCFGSFALFITHK